MLQALANYSFCCMRAKHNSSLAFILALAAPNALAYYRSCKQCLEGKNTEL